MLVGTNLQVYRLINPSKGDRGPPKSLRVVWITERPGFDFSPTTGTNGDPTDPLLSLHSSTNKPPLG